ncbi:sensor histidine kinase [Paenibacillus daejeonensis]|uniref:sensor histidine kinase n=1 Tax=Paenibacillus daejeonensis TaxID=135193 RepID=UPI0003613EAC|nr:sensor histidine kinase [Paenibacillus daejeonensis]
MLIRYLTARRSWLLLFAGLLGLTNALLLLDPGLAVESASLIYLNGLFLLIGVVFILWRYKRETAYAVALTRSREDLGAHWLEGLPEPGNSLDESIHAFLHAVDRHHKQEVSDVKGAQIIENDFTAAWIHEVNTPLTAMKLILDAHREDEAVRRIAAEWLRIHLLVDQQLYMTRLPSLESDYVLASVPVQRIAAEEVRELASWCMEKNLAISIEGAAAEVVTDRKWCRFVFRQLLTNAVKYSPSGATLLIVAAEDTAGHVTLEIHDEGPGIRPHDLPRIFDKGFTGDNGRIHNAATGLGLYLAKTVADKLGITLTAQSSAGHGTIMRMTFSSANAFEAVRRDVTS